MFDLPDEPPVIAVAASGPGITRIAASSATDCSPPNPTPSWSAPGGGWAARPRLHGNPLAWAQDEDAAVAAVLEKSLRADRVEGHGRAAQPGELEAATASIGPEQAREQFACGPDVKRHLQVAQQFVDAGFDHIWSP